MSINFRFLLHSNSTVYGSCRGWPNCVTDMPYNQNSNCSQHLCDMSHEFHSIPTSVLVHSPYCLSSQKENCYLEQKQKRKKINVMTPPEQKR